MRRAESIYGLCCGRGRHNHGFTLIEVLAAVAVLVLIMLSLMRIFNDTNTAVTRGGNMVVRTAAMRAAMDVLSKDLEGMVVDRLVGCYKESEVLDENFDTFFFVTMSDDSETERSYKLVTYYVTLNDQDAYTLMRGTRNIVNASSELFGQQYWQPGAVTFGSDALVDNIVRFDVYPCDEDGHLIGGSGGAKLYGAPPWATTYDSTEDSPLSAVPAPDPGAALYPAHTPPAYVEIYLQVTSESTFKRARALLDQTDNGLKLKGYSLLYQDSNVGLKRIVPIMSQAERIHPIPY